MRSAAAPTRDTGVLLWAAAPMNVRPIAIEAYARRGDFRKIVFFALAQNDSGERLYRKMGYRDISVFKERAVLMGAS